MLQYDGDARSYHLYEPPIHDDARPLVLVLHGGFATNDGTLGLGLGQWPNQVWLDIADEDNIYVAAPQGLNEHWNDCRPACDRCGTQDDKGFLIALLDALVAENNIDSRRIYVVGESNGGFMAQRLAMEVPDRFAGIGVIISLLPSDHTCEPTGTPIPIQYQVGTEDSAILYGGGQSGTDEALRVVSAADTLAYWSEVNQCEAQPTTSQLTDRDPDDGTTVTRDDFACTGAPLSMLHMVGAGHVPASIDAQVSAIWEGVAGVQNHDVESARVFWEFFENQ